MAASTRPAKSCNDLGSCARPKILILEKIFFERYVININISNLVKKLPKLQHVFPNIEEQHPLDNTPGNNFFKNIIMTWISHIKTFRIHNNRQSHFKGP